MLRKSNKMALLMFAICSRCERLMLKLLEAHYASVYGAAAEVVGLVLKFQNSQNEGEVVFLSS